MPWAATFAVAGPPDPASAGNTYVSRHRMLLSMLASGSLMPMPEKHHGLPHSPERLAAREIAWLHKCPQRSWVRGPATARVAAQTIGVNPPKVVVVYMITTQFHPEAKSRHRAEHWTAE